jgi:hypothetical protein
MPERDLFDTPSIDRDHSGLHLLFDPWLRWRKIRQVPITNNAASAQYRPCIKLLAGE